MIFDLIWFDFELIWSDTHHVRISVNKCKPVFMHDIFKTKDLSYQLRDSHNVFQTKFKSIRHGKCTFACYGSHIWNVLPNQVMQYTDILRFKSLLKTWEVLKCQCNMSEFLNRMHFVYIS